MTFPTILTQSSNTEDTATSTHTISYPSGLVTGNLLIGFCAVATTGSSASVTWSAADGWTERVEGNFNGAVGCAAYKEVSGSEGATTSFTTASTYQSAAYILQISGNSPWTFFRSSGNAASTNAPNTLSLDMGSSADHLWLSAIFVRNNDVDQYVTTWPSNYTSNQNELVSQGGGNQAYMAFCSRSTTAQTEDPGAYAMFLTQNTSCWTFGVQQTEGGGSPFNKPFSGPFGGPF
jgi:hypothetical protein